MYNFFLKPKSHLILTYSIKSQKTEESKVQRECEKGKEVHAISDEFEFDVANENEVNEPSNATLKDFDDYPVNDAAMWVLTLMRMLFIMINSTLRNPIKISKTLVLIIKCVCGAI